MKADTWTDQQIIGAINGSASDRDKALQQVYLHQGWKDAATRFVLSNGGNQADGEDLAQTALILFDRNVRLGSFKGQSALKTYFMAIAKYQWYKVLRSRKPTSELTPGHDVASGGDVEDRFISQEKKDFFAKALGQIGERCKQILLLQQLDHTLDEIAQAVGMSSAAMAKKEAYRCRLRFRAFLEAHPAWKEWAGW